MGYLVEQIGGFLRVTSPGGRSRNYVATDVQVEQRITDGDIQIIVDNRIQECFNYSQVDSPVGLDNDDLTIKIVELLNDALENIGGGSAPVGYSLETTQLQVLGAVDDIEPKLDTLITGVDALNSKIGLVDNEAHANIPSSTSQVLLQATNLNRKKINITNDSTQTLYVKKGAGVTSTNYSYKLYRGDSVVIDDYRQNIYGVWNVVNGFAMVVETY